jgi:Copper binding proteins, plastocyanin/azurin family
MQINKLAAATGIVVSLTVAAPLALASNGADDATYERASAGGAITLRGSVGPGYTISLRKNGQMVRSLRAGTYRFLIADHAAAHDFVLEKERGGRFERELTDVSEVGTKAVTIKLTRGTWKYYCEPHESVMSGSFIVR